MDNRLKRNEVFKTSHLVMLVSYTNLAIIMACATIAVHWETWLLPLVAVGVIGSWALHITQTLDEKTRLWIYAALMLVTSFFYGIHPEGIYDMVAIIAALILVFTMTGEKQMVLASMVTYYLTLGCVVAGRYLNGPELDRPSMMRFLLHAVLVFLIGWTAEISIRKWNQVLYRTETDIAKLKEETRRMDDFLTNVSHEIRTPVNAVIGLTTVILKREQDEELKKDIRTVQSAGHRVGEKIGDILDFTELDIGKLVVAREPYMIASLVNDLVTDLRMREGLECELIVDVAPEVPAALIGDGAKIKKILSHLIANGIKFTPKGGVRVHVYALPRPYGVNLCIEVSDTGIGMTDEELEHIFDSFYQHNSGRTRSAGGLGLGLTIVHGIVRQMGGFMTIESSVGNGTTVSVSIPQEVVDPDPCMSVNDRDQICLAAFVHLEKLEVPRVRDYYSRMAINLAHGLGVSLHWAQSEDELRKLGKKYRLTHVFVGAEEYLGATEYLESLTTSVDVIVIAGEAFRARRSAHVKVVRKPFYCFPAATMLSLPTKREETIDENKRIYMPGVEALVVDDEPMNLLVAEGIFSDYGMRVTTARSGIESIELCQKKHFDLIFMDHMMPEMDGVEAMKRLRSDAAQRGEELTILALTANAVSSAREMFLAEGFDGFIPKPIEVTDLERVLKRVLPQSKITYEYSAPEPAKERPMEPEPPDGAPESEAPPDELLAKLEAVGVRTESGLRYCRSDLEFYRSLLSEFAHSAAGKIGKMREYREAKDWANYAIFVHALKSTSKMIGADELSATAKRLETAAKAEDASTVEQEHEAMLARYEALSGAIMDGLGEAPSQAEADGGDEVLEFAPENEILEFAPEEEQDGH